MQTEATTRLVESLRSVWRKPDRRKPSEWCSSLWLPASKDETEPGRVRFDSRPYLREPLDQLENPSVTDITVVMPTRNGKTFLLRMAFALGIAKEPSSMMWVDSTIDKARSISRKELQPLVEANTILRERKPLDRHHYTNTLMLFQGASFTMVGANSVAGVAGDTVKMVLGNEVDKWASATEKEASIIELVRHRTESFNSRRKHFLSSTPTLEEGPIWQTYLQGDQRQFVVPCLHCGYVSPLTWDGVGKHKVWWNPEAELADGKWDLRSVKDSACITCGNCGAHWTEKERLASVADSRSHWEPTCDAAVPGYVSYHLNGLYGPLEVNTPASLAVDFLKARGSGLFTDRRDFWNSRMGLPWRDEVSSITQEKFQALEQVRRGELPEGQWDLLVVGADVQTWGVPWVITAYKYDGKSHTFDHGVAASWADVELVQREYSAKYDIPSNVIIDINFEARRVETLEAIYMRQSLGWLGAEGFESTNNLAKMELVNPFMGGQKQALGFKIPKLVISLYDAKVNVEEMLSGKNMMWTTYKLTEESTGQEKAEQKEYYVQLTDERRVPRKRKIIGKPPMEWKSRNNNNHYFDCLVYSTAFFNFKRKTVGMAQSIDAQKRSTTQRRVMNVKR